MPGTAQEQAGKSRDKQGQAGTKKRQAGTRQGQTGTSRDIPCLSLLVPTCPCLSLSLHAIPCLSLSVPVCSCLTLSARSLHVCLYICNTSMSTPGDGYNFLHRYEHSFIDFPWKCHCSNG